MKLKKKIVVTTVAASVVASAFAGIPFSDKGLAAQLGIVNVASAADASFVDATTLDRLQKLHAELAKSASTLETIRKARKVIQDELDKQIAANDYSVVKPLVDKINAEYPGLLTDEDAKYLLTLVTRLVNVAYYDPQAKELENLRNDEVIRKLVQKLANPNNPDNNKPGVAYVDVKVSDFTAFVLAVEAELKKAAGTKTFTQFAAEYMDGAKATELAKTVISTVLSNKSLTFSKIADQYDLERETLDEVYDLYQDKIPTVDRGKLKAAALLIADAYYNLFLKETTTPIFPGGGIIPTTPSVSADAAVKAIEALKDAIAKATGVEKEKLIEQAAQEAAKAIAALATVDVSKDVKVVDGKATLALSKAAVEQAINDIAKVVKALEAVAPEAKAKLPKINVAVNLGAVTATSTAVTLTSDAGKLAADNGIAGFALNIGNFSATLPVGGSFTGEVVFGVSNKAADNTTTGTLKSASDVYDFSLTIGGKATTQFDKPVVVKIPLKNIEGLDKELLSIAKLNSSKLLFKGGVVDGNTITEARDTFSSYVVVENKVSFTDTASVKAWAGRQIEVMAAKGAIEGRGQSNFAPKDNVTRAEFAKILVSALDLETNGAKASFSDVKGTEWFAPYVAAAAEQGIIKGRSATQFAPNATITRAEMATMVARALEASKGLDTTVDAAVELKDFSDANSIQASLKDGVAFAASKGLVIGNNGKFSPTANASRAEAAVIIYRAFNFKG
ncbi:S-layer homology domain-containing protein [Paenibacillus methanolicus]|uniref:S-layer family protein n=1 Tax=Paenibacillus methanolicus TaxID=582686 RepID=A0A5S5CBD3_9BACL|nr:S-layer homology domain-containing protein [Paenibacillus methanolicus]TYP75656.1 S-layer family protein [Paenibacillus methanolicus]